MTRTRIYGLTGFSAALFLLLNWAFADNQFSGHWWDAKAITDSNIFTYLLLAAIVGAGVLQARRISDPVPFAAPTQTDIATGQIEDPSGWKLLLGNVFFAIAWMPIRFFVGREWLSAGEGKLRSDGWMHGGSSLKGFWTNAVAIPDTGRPAITYGWFRNVLQYMLNHQWYTWFGKVIAIGETLVGLGLILGALVGVAAFFGTVLNFNFQLAGSASTNPVLFGLGVLLVLAWKVAGWWGLDRVLLPRFGTPWAPGKRFVRQATVANAAPAMHPPAVIPAS